MMFGSFRVLPKETVQFGLSSLQLHRKLGFGLGLGFINVIILLYPHLLCHVQKMLHSRCA